MKAISRNILMRFALLLALTAGLAFVAASDSFVSRANTGVCCLDCTPNYLACVAECPEGDQACRNACLAQRNHCYIHCDPGC